MLSGFYSYAGYYEEEENLLPSQESNPVLWLSGPQPSCYTNYVTPVPQQGKNPFIIAHTHHFAT
jgi:hypothetical protein